MDESSNLKLPYIIAAQAQKHVTHNEAVRALDAIVQLSVLDRDLTVPPVSPLDGDRYIPAASSTADWSGHDFEVAAFQDGAWVFYTPKEGWIAWVADEDALLAWDGSAWVPVGSGGGGGGGSTTFKGLTDTPPNFTGSTGKVATVNAGETALEFKDQLPVIGVNTAPDATNKLKVASAAILFDNVGAGQQTKINKNASADTASLLFQTNFSGRAEMGLAGDDDYHFKVSPDGTVWNEAILIDKTTGAVSFPNSSLGGNIAVEDEGLEVLASATRLNFAGAGVVVTDAGSGEATVTISGSGGGGGGDMLAANNLSDVASTATSRTNLGLAIGTDVQAFHARLADLAAAAWAQGDVAYFDGTNLVRLPAGTSGQVLQTNGTGANPSWANTSGGGGGGTTEYFLVITDEKTNGTNGGTFTAGAWRTRDLNTIKHNGISGASLSSNQITLPAGTYIVEASTPAFYVNRHQARLYDTTNTTILSLGSSALCSSGSASTFDTTESTVRGAFVLSGTATVELQHRSQTTRATDGFGIQGGLGSGEVYSTIKIAKIA